MDAMQKVYQQKILDIGTHDIYRYEILLHDDLDTEFASSVSPIAVGYNAYAFQETFRGLVRVAVGLPDEVQQIISMNVTNRILVDFDMMEILLENLQDLPYGLTIEVTQIGDLPEPRRLNAVLSGLRQHNCSVDFDNFGGPNSRTPQILSEYFFDAIKLNGKFVQSALLDDRLTRLLALLNDMIKAQGKVLIATGVSTSQQSEALASLGIVLQQGDFIHSPELVS
jgi:EAL domain-containing protein (putative c-di-GMP-specific phosphodiesterase class I)